QFKTNLRPEPLSNQYGLTTQEKRILQLLVEGKSYKMIGGELFIATDTVKAHIRNLYAKLQVHSGTEAVSLALRNKIV
ncbi:MAG: response regulator transcription factor, partial [Gloeobacteraceae cyanobacterium ES-bin-316]|nr:response regulator transcription factor [Ferruginibacter sp.]